MEGLGGIPLRRTGDPEEQNPQDQSRQDVISTLGESHNVKSSY